MLDPRRLLSFRAVATHGSFSRAAEALALTQSAVSQQIAALEREAGTRLLHRDRGNVRPTAAGAQLLAHADVVAERLGLADAQLADLVAADRRELRIGAFPSALATLVPAAVATLLAGDPQLQVSVEEGATPELAARVRDGRLHAAVLFQDAAAPRREHPGTRRHDLLEEPFVAALGPRHRLARRRSLPLAALADDPWTAASRDGLIVRACRTAGFTPRIAFLSRDPLAIRAVVAAGLAVTITPQGLGEHLDGVHVVPLEGEPARRTVYALLPDAGTRPLDHALLALLSPTD